MPVDLKQRCHVFSYSLMEFKASAVGGHCAATGGLIFLQQIRNKILLNIQIIFKHSKLRKYETV